MWFETWRPERFDCADRTLSCPRPDELLHPAQNLMSEHGICANYEQAMELPQGMHMISVSLKKIVALIVQTSAESKVVAVIRRSAVA